MAGIARASTSFCRVAALLVATAPVAVWGQACPSNDRPSGSAESARLPTIMSYGITAVNRPPNARDVHQAIVTGGHATEGDFRIDMVLSADVPSNCELPLEIFDPTVSARARNEGDMGRAGDAIARPDRFATRHRYMIRTDGANRATVTIGTLATFSERTDALALTIGDFRRTDAPPAYGFTITRRPIAAMTVTASPDLVPAGGTVTITAMMPGGLSDSAFADPVVFSVSPASAGTFRRLPGSATPPPVRGTVSPNLAIVNPSYSPQRAQILFEPARGGTSATIFADVAGGRRSVAVTLLNGPVVQGSGGALASPSTSASASAGTSTGDCRPVATFERVAGGIELNIANTGDKPCPAFRAELRKGPATLGVLDVPVLVPSGKAAAASARASMVRMAGMASADWTGTFRIDDANLASGAPVTARLLPVDRGDPAIDLGTVAVPPAQ